MRTARGATLWAALAGLLHAASVASPIDGQASATLNLLALAVFAALLLAAPSARTPLQTAVIAWAFATASIAGATWWLFISMHVYGGLAAPLAVGAVLALAAFLGLYWAAAGALLRLVFAPDRPIAGAQWLLFAIVFASLALGTDLARAQAFTGFPWGTTPYAHVDGVLAGLAPWVGAFGMGWAAAFVAALLAAVAVFRQVLPLLPAVVILGLGFALTPTAPPPATAARGAAPAPLTVRLLQGNIPQDEKFQPGTGVPLALDWYRSQLLGSPAALTIAPETAIPVLPARLPANYWDQLSAHFAVPGRAALIGIPTGSFEQGYANSVVGLSDHPPYRYNKHHLVPFGEFIPPLFKWFVRLMNIPLGDFDAGPVAAPSFVWRHGGLHERLAINICYEDLFGEELAARFADPATAPTIFVNASNIGWFGNSVAIDQHLNIARLRAIEFARPTLRATNTGATAFIDKHGRVVAEMPRHARGVLDVALHGETDITPYAHWMARTGLWVWWAVAWAGIALAFGLVRRSRG